MQPKVNWFSPLLLFFLEWVVFLILSTPFVRWAKSPGQMIFSISLTAVLIVIGFLFLKVKLKSGNMAYYLVWTMAIAAVSWLGHSFPIVLSLLFAIYFMWRTLNFLDGQTNEIRWWFFLLTVFGALILKLFIKHPFIQKELIVLLGIQTLIILTYEAVEEWRKAKRLTGTLSFLAGFAVIGLAGGLLKLLFPYIKWILNEILNACLFVIMFLVKFLWELMSKLLGPRMASHKDALNNLFKSFKKQPKKVEHHQVSHHIFSPEIFMIIVVILIIGVAFYFFRKWQFTKGTSIKRFETVPGTFGLRKEEKKSRFFSHLKAPKDPIRAHLFNLQKKLRKREEGRLQHESVGEWLTRLTKDAPLKARIQSTYEFVRYGGNTPANLSENQVANFETAIKQVETQLFNDDSNKT